MEQTDRIEAVEELLAKASAGDYDDPAYAYLWTEVGKLAVGGLHASGVRVVRDESQQREEDEPIGDLEHGWASTPVEVQAWCDSNGIPYELGGKVSILARFEDKPDDETRAALKAAGFRWDKPAKVWTHKAFGQYERSEKVQDRRENGEPEREERKAGASW